MNNLQVHLPKPHPGQVSLLRGAKRFNVVRCGRRWGKTELAVELIVIPALKGQRVGYFTPINKTLIEVWEKVLEVLSPVIFKKNTTFKRIYLKTGGLVEFWSLSKENSPRGRAYHRLLVDEAAFLPDLKNKFSKTLRPMLLDFQGDGFLLSSPNGYNDFYDIEQLAAKFTNTWSIFHATAYDNPYLLASEIELIKAETDPDIFAQEYLAEYVTFHGSNFIRYFSRAENVKSVYFNPKLEVYFSFDFNVKSTCLVIQRPTEYTTHILEEIHMEGLENICAYLKKSYPGLWIVNGDASGNARSSTNSRTAYDIIRNELDLIWEQVHVQSHNPTHYESFVFCNYVFKNHTVYIDPSCKMLINDIERVKVIQEKGRFEIDKTNEQLTHFSDCLTGETLIETSLGVKPIEKIKTGEYVLTRQGYKKVIDTFSRANAEVFTYQINGFEITSTPEHKIFTLNRGFIPVSSLIVSDIISILPTWKQLNMQAEYGQGTHKAKDDQTEFISNQHANISTDISGNSLMGKSLKATTYTIRTVIHLIMTYLTLSAFRQKIILTNTYRNTTTLKQNVVLGTLKTSDLLPKNGTDQKKAYNGTENMQKIAYGKIQHFKKVIAMFAEKNFKQKRKSGLDFAPIIVSLPTEEKTKPIILRRFAYGVKPSIHTTNITPECIVVNHVQVKETIRQSVYDLTVEDGHEFYANGILVHNCLRYHLAAEHWQVVNNPV